MKHVRHNAIVFHVNAIAELCRRKMVAAAGKKPVRSTYSILSLHRPRPAIFLCPLERADAILREGFAPVKRSKQ